MMNVSHPGATSSRAQSPSRRFLAVLAATFAFLAMALANPTSVRADAIDDALTKFTTDRFPDTEKGIGDLAASGHAQAADILEALGGNRLYFDPIEHKLFYKTADGTMMDARSGAKSNVEEGALKKVRLNNAVRGAMQAAQGSLLPCPPSKPRWPPRKTPPSSAPSNMRRPPLSR